MELGGHGLLLMSLVQQDGPLPTPSAAAKACGVAAVVVVVTGGASAAPAAPSLAGLAAAAATTIMATTTISTPTFTLAIISIDRSISMQYIYICGYNFFSRLEIIYSLRLET